MPRSVTGKHPEDTEGMTTDRPEHQDLVPDRLIEPATTVSSSITSSSDRSQKPCPSPMRGSAHAAGRLLVRAWGRYS